MSEYILGIDIGTTSVKAVLISSECRVVGEASSAHDLISLHANWAEEDALVWWRGACEAVRRLSAQFPREMGAVRCIGCSGMVPAIVLLDEAGTPLRNTIQQNDARATDQIGRIAAVLDQQALFARTGGYTNQQHILPRLLWVKENEPEVWARVRTVMGSYDYILYRLTGERSVELNWAAESGSFDIHTRCWIPEGLEAFGIDPAILPPVNDSGAVVGHVAADVAAALGIPAGTPVIAGAADHVASALASGITEPGDLLIKFGGAGDILYCMDGIATHPKLFFDYHIIPGKSLPNGCMAASGSLLKWFVRDILGEDMKTALKGLDEAAAKLPAASDGVIVLPYFLGEKTPLFDPDAKGVFYGLGLSHTRIHLYRAVLESVIYGFRHHIDELEATGQHPTRVIASDGGAKSRLWCQIAADVLGCEVRVYAPQLGSSLGSAFLAGKTAGVYKDWDDIRRFLTDELVYQPDMEAHRIYDRAYETYRALYRQLKPCFEHDKGLYDN